MPLAYDGTGGLFTRLGKLIKTLDDLNTYRGTGLPARVAAIEAEYLAANQDVLDSVYSQLAAAQGSLSGFAGYLRSLASATVAGQVGDAVALPDTSLLTALRALVADMQANGEAVKRCTVAATVTPGGSNTGDAVVICGTTDSTGLPLEYALAETITGTVTTDAPTGGAAAGRERLTFRGIAGVSDSLSADWPGGSGSVTSLTAIDATADNGSQTANWLTDGAFEGVWTGNVPAGWHVGTGTAGTSILQSTAEHYGGANSLELVGDGSEQTSLYTELGVDTRSSAAPYDQLASCLRLKLSGAAAAGVLSVELVDGSGTQIQDAQGNASAFTVDLTAATTSWVAHGGFLRTPRVLPASVRLRLRLSTALSSGVSLFIDHVALARPVQCYTGGPFLACFSGATPLINGDSFAVAVTNDRGGLLQTGLERLLSLRAQGVILPSSGSPSIADTLIA